MCTAATYTNSANAFFGRNLDLDFHYDEEITIIPRNFPLPFREVGTLESHYAIIGVAYIQENYPLLYDAINEKGLGMAGLNFVGNAVYADAAEDRDNIAQFEFIPWILSQCANVAEAKQLLTRINIRSFSFSEQLPAAELHWIISDCESSIVIESTHDGLHVYDNPTGMLTNNPPFPEQLFRLNDYQALSARAPINNFAPSVNLPVYSRGMGAIGLPGDLSSGSRFVRATFTKFNSVAPDDELSTLSQYFHILHSVDQQRGCADLGDQKYEITIYSSGYNLSKGICYYTSYDNHQITMVDLHQADLDQNTLYHQPLITTEQIHQQSLV